MRTCTDRARRSPSRLPTRTETGRGEGTNQRPVTRLHRLISKNISNVESDRSDKYKALADGCGGGGRAGRASGAQGGGRRGRRQLGVLLLYVLLELVASMLAVGAVRTLVLRLPPALQRHVPHEVLAGVVAALAVGTAVALVGLVLSARQLLRSAREHVVARLRLSLGLGLGLWLRFGRGVCGRRGLGAKRSAVVLLDVVARHVRGAHVLEDGERRGERRLLAHFFTPRHNTMPGGRPST